MSEHEPEKQEPEAEEDFEGQGFNPGGRADETPDEPGPQRENEHDES
jgi:hypothetical protein